MRPRHYRSSCHLTARQFQAFYRFSTHISFEGYETGSALPNSDQLREMLPKMVRFSAERRIFLDAMPAWSFGKLSDDSLSAFFAAQLAYSFRPFAIDMLGAAMRSNVFCSSVEAAEHLGDLLILLPPSALRMHVRDQFVKARSILAQKEYSLGRNHALFKDDLGWHDQDSKDILNEPVFVDPITVLQGLFSSLA
ncbi:MAG: hypothetical protein ACP5N9_02285 [Candidatus Bilamarchaeum sp.]